MSPGNSSNTPKYKDQQQQTSTNGRKNLFIEKQQRQSEVEDVSPLLLCPKSAFFMVPQTEFHLPVERNTPRKKTADATKSTRPKLQAADGGLIISKDAVSIKDDKERQQPQKVVLPTKMFDHAQISNALVSPQHQVALNNQTNFLSDKAHRKSVQASYRSR